MTLPCGRRQAQRIRLAALGLKARQLTRTMTIAEVLEEIPELSRSSIYRAMRYSVDEEARVKSGHAPTRDPLLS